jgi:hypothetical protein
MFLVLGVALLAACGGGGGSPTASTPTTPANPVPTPAPTPTPQTFNVSGDWRSQARSWNFRLRQDGTTITGVVLGFKNTGYPQSDPAVQITGSISQNGALVFRAPVWAIDFEGSAAAGGLRITGTLYDCANGCRTYGEVLDKQ